ncbi:MAG: cation:proton antiporter family protein [Porticoccaceae bacterium]|nr:cation:proton antiporter [Pseudomonadales bacterium]MCP5173145.1 cation:proton antiporter [Pseudomonadales bacterium]
MDYIWIAVAFVFGFFAKQITLPPLIGYLAAGFGLHALGVQPDDSLQTLSDLGITLLLFTIGLKLNIRSLFKTEIWAGASGHMAAIVLLTTVNSLVFGYLGFKYFVDLNWQSAALIGFAVSFSSTVCAIKILEERGELRARHGQVAIGILVIQDIAAVIFVTLASGKAPSAWALVLLALPLLRPVLDRVLIHCGHGEILTLAGFFLALSFGELFELVGLKAHLGALVIGVLLSGHEKAVELSKSLLSFKDIFLIGFFLSIGFTALPTVDMLGVALIMAIALPIKAGMFFVWTTRLKLRSRTAFLSAVSLANYSEFGLIVCSVSVGYGLLAKEWLVIMALAVSLSFVFSGIINANAHRLYSRLNSYIKHFEHPERLPEDPFPDVGNASVLVVGMGRVGSGAYDALHGHLQKNVCGIDVDKERIEEQRQAGRRVIVGDAEDPDFWASINLESIRLIIFSMPNYLDSIEAAKLLRQVGYQGKTASIAKYKDQKALLLEAGIDEVFNYFSEVGAGLAEQSIHLVNS